MPTMVPANFPTPREGRWPSHQGRGADPPSPQEYVAWARGAPDYVLFATEDGTSSVVAQLGDASPLMAEESYGGWEQVTVPGQRSRPVWRGVSVPSISLALMFDGWGSAGPPRPQMAKRLGPHRSVEGECRELERMAGLTAGFKEAKPPRLIVAGATIPHGVDENPHYRWLIASLAWGDPSVRVRPTGDRVRQGFGITLILDNPTEELERIKPRKSKPKYRFVEAREGDTYRKIAARKLGSARLGQKLAELNDARDPSKKLKKGKKVRLPTDHLLAIWRREILGHR